MPRPRRPFPYTSLAIVLAGFLMIAAAVLFGMAFK